MGQAKIKKLSGTNWTPEASPLKPVLPIPVPPLVWHYTVGACIERILADGELHVSAMAEGRGQPILWFSANPEWEPTAGKKIIVDGKSQPLDRTGTEQWYGGLYRIGVSPSILKLWAELKQTTITKYKPEAMTRFENWGKSLGANPLDWWGTFDNVRSEHWVTIERFDGGWRELHQHDEIPPASLPMPIIQPNASEIATFWKSWRSRKVENG